MMRNLAYRYKITYETRYKAVRATSAGMRATNEANAKG